MQPLWVAPFPRQEILNSVSGEGELSVNVHRLTYCPVLLNMDRMCLVASSFCYIYFFH